MPIFSKFTYREVSLPFIHDYYSEEYKESIETGLIDIEACGMIDGVQKYFYASFALKKSDMYRNGDYEQMINLIKENQGKQVIVRLKYKKGSLVDFKILLESLVKAYNDNRFLEMELLARRINSISCKERGKF